MVALRNGALKVTRSMACVTTCFKKRRVGAMDALNFVHVLQDRIQDIGLGVRLSKQDAIPSKTMVAYLDERNAGRRLRIGYSYKNGSNRRIATWNWVTNTQVKTTTPAGILVFAFDEVRTTKGINDNFVRADFDTGNALRIQEAEDILQGELETILEEDNQFNDFLARLSSLTMDEIRAIQLPQ